MIIKVCGMTQPANIAEVAEAGADWIGFVFYPPSPRFMSMIPSQSGLLPDRARPLCLPDGVKKAGVFVDASAQDIITRVVNFGLDIVQLHGDEPPTMLRNLRRTLEGGIRPGVKLVKAISISSAGDMARCADYEDCADLLLFDTRCPGAGGSGRQFDWSALYAYNGSLPFMLSGGIGPSDEERIAAMGHPKLAGVDLNSRFETAPGVKDAALVGKFIARLRELTRTQTDVENQNTRI